MSFLAGVFSLLGAIGFFLALDARARLGRAERVIRALQAQLSSPAAIAPPAPTAQTASAAAQDARPEILQETRAEAPPETPPRPARPDLAAPRLPAAPTRSLEETIGARWAVYVGGLALALGGLLLVRYALEQGWFGPAARVTLGLLLSAGLIGAGESLRRREARASAPTPTPAVLTAAGTVAGFGAIYAAHALYGFIGPSLALIALGAAGLAAMLAAALHGPAIAGLGLAGALAAPLLTRAETPNPWPVMVYVAVVVGAAYGLARLRDWLWLALAGAVGAAAWGVMLTHGGGADFPVAAEVHFAIQTALACFAFALDGRALALNPRARLIAANAAPVGLALVAALMLAVCANRGAFGAAWTISAEAIVCLLAFTGHARALRAPALLAGAGAVAFGLLLLWPAESFHFDLIEAPPLERARFLVFSAASAALVAGLAGVRLWKQRDLPALPAQILAATLTLTPLALLAIVWLRLTQTANSLPFGALAAGLGLGFAAFAGFFRTRDADSSHDKLGLGATAAAALAALALGLVFTLDRGMLTVALALSALGAAYVESRLRIPLLRRAVTGLGLIIAVRLAWEPRIVGDELGATPIVNWLLFGYGVPALAFGWAARLMRQSGGEDRAARIAETLAIVFAALLVFFEIRHALHGGDPFAPDSGLVELGLFALSAFGFSAVLTRLDVARASPVFHFFSLAFGVVSALIAVFGLALAQNPFFDEQPVEGGVLVNALLLGYALPAIAGALFVAMTERLRPVWFVRAMRLVALMLTFLYVTLQTRRFFQGPTIGWSQEMGATENYAYSAAWLALGVALLAYGLLRRSLESRVASALVILLAVLKVFVFDLAALAGAQRALSFIGLGAVLIGIGLVYQKFVFRPAQPSPSAPK